MEPGTGTQYATIAKRGETYNAGGRVWKVGHDYIDTEIGDVCELVHVTAKSGWCDTHPPEEGTPKLIFEYDRYENTLRLDPNDPSCEVVNRFIERYEATPHYRKR